MPKTDIVTDVGTPMLDATIKETLESLGIFRCNYAGCGATDSWPKESDM